MNTQDWSPLGLTGLIFLKSRDSQESSPTPQFKSINSSTLSFLYSPTLTSKHDYWKNHSFDRTDLCWQSNVSSLQHTWTTSTSPITSWQIDGETMETVTDFIFLASKITADSDCRREIKRHLLLGRKAMTNLDSVLKSRDITLPTKVRLVKAMVFPVVMYGCESWAIKKAECWRTDTFELWCWRRLLRVLGWQGDPNSQS